MVARRRLSIVDCYNSEAPFATEFRRLLHRIRSNDERAELKSLLVTSATLAEGKSTVCSFLGITAAAHKGLKTLLIDCDLRRPNIDRFFNLDRDYGLVEILADGFSAMDAIKKSGIDKLDIITSGRLAANPSTVFDAEAIGTVVDEMKFYYDLIILDSPPVIPVSDPMLLSSRVDGLLLVVRAGSTQKEVAQRALEILNATRDRIVGVILNDMNRALPYHYDYSYYGYESNQRSKRPKEGSSHKGRLTSKREAVRKAGFEKKT